MDDSIFLDRGPELPESYGEDRLDLLVRNPRSILAYWSLDGERSRREMDSAGTDAFRERRWILRVNRGETTRAFDLAVDPSTRKIYFSVNEGGSYGAELGVLGDDGDLDVYARSETLEPPLPDRVPEDVAGVAKGGARETRGPGSAEWAPTSPSGRRRSRE